MADKKKSPYEGLDLVGQVRPSEALDQQLFQSKPRRQMQEAPSQASTETSTLDTLEARKQGSKEANILPSKQPQIRKATFGLPVEDLDNLDDMKRILSRQYGIRTSKERIVIEGIRLLFADLQGNKETSILVSTLTGKHGKK
ncbi:MAG: hypothetical protein M3Y27_03395 [Acidobacteriota bacterium]|nr:hypothetical protein [Acidobacteriota bacterium]